MEIKFKRDTAFRKQFFVPDSFAHPAKMDAQLLIWIVERYTKVGETILDPMAGSGTAMLACGLGRNVVLVELEEKFCKMMRDNWDEVKMSPQLGCSMGGCQIIQGDARNLEGLLADKIISSPPYGNRLSDAEVDDGDPQRMSYRQALGKVDKIVTSPPYASGGTKADENPENYIRREEERLKLFPNRPKTFVGRYSGDRDNIGNLPYGQIDKIVTSPPYEGSNTTGQPNSYQGIHGPNSQVQLRDYRETKDNIGNLKSGSYLSAMLQVYQQCFSVLKDGGLMVLVTKNFIRNKQVIRLDLDTIKLCEQAGFKFIERHYRKLPSQSFWRVIYHQKHPEVEQLDYEDILVLAKI